jgi:nitrite reductase/ring-hydroxylating ferredoxin subunit
MSDFTDVCAAGELEPGKCMETRVGDKAVALVNAEGSICAVSNTCLHRGGPLGQGFVQGSLLICPWHAWAFDARTGVSDVNPEMVLDRYEVRVENGRILVKT